MKFCKNLQLDISKADTHEERIKFIEVIRQIESDLTSLAKANNFNSLEKIKANFDLVPEEFEIGVILTPTLKLRRKFAREAFAE